MLSTQLAAIMSATSKSAVGTCFFVESLSLSPLRLQASNPRVEEVYRQHQQQVAARGSQWQIPAGFQVCAEDHPLWKGYVPVICCLRTRVLTLYSETAAGGRQLLASSEIGARVLRDADQDDGSPLSGQLPGSGNCLRKVLWRVICCHYRCRWVPRKGNET